MTSNLPTSPRRIGIDIDGVLANFTYPVAELASQMFGLEVSGYAKTWNWMRDYGVTGDKEKQLWGYLQAHPSWWGSLPALEGAETCLRILDAHSFYADVYFITSRPGDGMKAASEGWLRMHGYTKPTVLIVNGLKGPVAKALGLDFFVDDRPENVKDVLDQKIEQTWIVDRPWNQGYAHTTLIHEMTANERRIEVKRADNLIDVLGKVGLN